MLSLLREKRNSYVSGCQWMVKLLFIKMSYLQRYFCNSHYHTATHIWNWKGLCPCTVIIIMGEYDISGSWLRAVCGSEDLCRFQSCTAYPDYCDGSKWHVLCSPGTAGEVRDWITAPIDYFSHHCPSERPGQEMHPPLCGLQGRAAPLYCLQSGWLDVNHCSHFVNEATITGCAFSWDYLINELVFPGSQVLMVFIWSLQLASALLDSNPSL